VFGRATIRLGIGPHSSLGYISVAENLGISLTTFRQCVLKATELAEITQKRPLRRSRSFKVTDFGNNRKLIYDFLLAINTNLPSILHRFRDIAVDMSEIAIFCYPFCV